MKLLAALVLLPLATACAAVAPPATADPVDASAAPPLQSRELIVSEIEWKERLEQPYVYLEVFGDYRSLGVPMRKLFERARLAEVDVSGPPFVLYFDDPGVVPVDRLRARVCLPVRSGARSAPGLQADLLPRAMVAYARVAGAYPELPRVHPALFRYVQDHGWTARGPLREIYHVDPGTVSDWRELESELQLPWVPGA